MQVFAFCTLHLWISFEMLHNRKGKSGNNLAVKRVEGLTLDLKSMENMMQSAQLFIKKHSTRYVLNGQ
jgi:hypothetical protein